MATMVEDAILVPEEGREYSVVLGQSLLVLSAENELNEGDDAGHALFQYKFTPASVDATIPGLVSVDESGGATVVRGTTAQSAEGGVTFKGKKMEQKETECLLIFDGASFRLERCDIALAQLRHVRAAPSQRPPPSALPDPSGKKGFRLGFGTRSGKVGRPATRTRQAGVYKGSESSKSHSEPVTAGEPDKSTAPTTASSRIQALAAAADTSIEVHAAPTSPSTKRRRLDE